MNCDHQSGKIIAIVKLGSSFAFREMKTYSESRNELRNLQIFLSSEQPYYPKTMDLSLIIAGVQKYPRKKRTVAVNTGGYSIQNLTPGSVGGGGSLFSVAGDSQISLIWCRRHLITAIQFAVSCSDLHFARCCALKPCGLEHSGRKARLCVHLT